MWILLGVMLALSVVNEARAGVVNRPVEYKQDGTVLVGYLAYDDQAPGKRPGVLVIPEFWGLNEFAKKQAERLAQMGYVALAADMYGQGKVTREREEATKLAGQVRGTPLMRQRALAGLKVLAAQPQVDTQRLAAIGFCFGGTGVLELAYTGAEVRGVVSFHGGLTSPKDEDLLRIKAKVLVLHGADDPLVKPEDIARFQEGMRKSGADWQMIYYGGAVHSFTNPEAGSDKSKGVAYDEKAARRSWEDMKLFFEEIFSRPEAAGGK